MDKKKDITENATENNDWKMTGLIILLGGISIFVSIMIYLNEERVILNCLDSNGETTNITIRPTQDTSQYVEECRKITFNPIKYHVTKKERLK